MGRVVLGGWRQQHNLNLFKYVLVFVLRIIFGNRLFLSGILTNLSTAMPAKICLKKLSENNFFFSVWTATAASSKKSDIPHIFSYFIPNCFDFLFMSNHCWTWYYTIFLRNTSLFLLLESINSFLKTLRSIWILYELNDFGRISSIRCYQIGISGSFLLKISWPFLFKKWKSLYSRWRKFIKVLRFKTGTFYEVILITKHDHLNNWIKI